MSNAAGLARNWREKVEDVGVCGVRTACRSERSRGAEGQEVSTGCRGGCAVCEATE